MTTLSVGVLATTLPSVASMDGLVKMPTTSGSLIECSRPSSPSESYAVAKVMLCVAQADRQRGRVDEHAPNAMIIHSGLVVEQMLNMVSLDRPRWRRPAPASRARS